MSPRPVPCFTPPLIEAVLGMQRAVCAMTDGPYPASGQPVRFVVLESNDPRTFSTGGDLAHIVDCIAAGDAVALRRYGYAGTRACHGLVDGMGASVITVALVRGAALGSGFEAARCCDIVVAEHGCTFELPETRFGLFPANGAVSVLGRRIGAGLLRRMVLDRVVLKAEEALAAGVVDHLVPVGEGEAAARRVIEELHPNHPAAAALYKGSTATEGITLDGMLSETERWVSAAMQAPDLPAMRRLVDIQAKRFGASRRGGPSCR